MSATVVLFAILAWWLFQKVAKAHEEHDDRIQDLERRLAALGGGGDVDDDDDSVEAIRARGPRSVNIKGGGRTCPKCHLLNPPTASTCDCGTRLAG